MAPPEGPDAEGEQDRTVAIGLLALLFLALAGLWSGLAGEMLWALALVTALLAGIFLVRSGAQEGGVILPTLGSALLLAVLVPFLVHFMGAPTGPGGPWVPAVAAVVAPTVSWGRLGGAERALGLLGALGILLFLIRPLATPLDLVAMSASALLLMVALAVAVGETRH